MKCIFIYNPVSGKGKISKKLDYIKSELGKRYETVDVKATQGPGDMSKFARDAVGQYDAIIFSGGDGSFNEVVQGLADLDNTPALGYIPSGTVNDIAHSLKIPKKIKKALKVIQAGRVETLDCMKANDRYSLYVVAAGIFTDTSYSTSQSQKNHLGKLAYGLDGIKRNMHFKEFKIDCNDCNTQVHYEDCTLVTFMNGRYVSGFNTNKHSSMQDGKIEVAIVRGRTKANIFRKIAALLSVAKLFLFGYGAKSKHIIHMEGSSFDVSVADDIIWTIDGEKGPNGGLHIEVVPKRINVIVSKKYKVKQ
ncbi:MAG: diacylglycerol kinase family lipid kinase [Clostridiales bacterium]|nr:diacylglycerol kinase family lipid kinase [Clostridiales bacterium]